MLLGIDLGGTKIEVAALAENGTTLVRRRVATPAGDYEATIDAIRRLVVSIEGEFGRAAGVGLGVPGSPSPRTGLMRNANSTCLNGRPLQRDLEAALVRTVRIANDANCLAVSEAVDGAGAGSRIVFAAILGTGCGAGIAIDGRAHAGRNGIAGEFGHTPLPWATGDEVSGPACWCGRLGCCETFLSGTGFAARHAAETGRSMRAEEIVAAAEDGDAAATRSLDLYVDQLGRALAGVIDLVDPDVIVLGGGMSNVDRIYAGIGEAIAPHVFSDGFETPVRRARHGDSSGVRGAAWLWRN